MLDGDPLPCCHIRRAAIFGYPWAWPGEANSTTGSPYDKGTKTPPFRTKLEPGIDSWCPSSTTGAPDDGPGRGVWGRRVRRESVESRARIVSSRGRECYHAALSDPGMQPREDLTE